MGLCSLTGPLWWLPVVPHCPGNTEEYGLMLDKVAQMYPDSVPIAVGFSMGGNIILKYLGENKEHQSKVICALCCCTGFDIALWVERLCVVFCYFPSILLDIGLTFSYIDHRIGKTDWYSVDWSIMQWFPTSQPDWSMWAPSIFSVV